jgi:3-oxoacyl-[acyl-carrier-protein] synthase-1
VRSPGFDGMAATPIALLACGLVTSVGMSAAASCAALRVAMANPSETELINAQPEPFVVHRVPLAKPWQGLPRLARMAALAADEALAEVPQAHRGQIPLLLCVAEAARVGRVAELEERLPAALGAALGCSFTTVRTIPQGRVGVAVALHASRTLIRQDPHTRVLVVAVDSLLSATTLAYYAARDRLLADVNSNGFIAGEGAGALLLGAPGSAALQTICAGIGFGKEEAHIESTLPLRGDGLTAALRGGLAEADCALHEMDYRITDLSGEQYGFKEANLGVVRLLRAHKGEFDLWHPAESTGETGAAAGAVMVALADAAARGGYARGPRTLLHMGNDSGERAALVLRYGAP